MTNSATIAPTQEKRPAIFMGENCVRVAYADTKVLKIDLTSSSNPLMMSPLAFKEAKTAINDQETFGYLYPVKYQEKLREYIAEKHNVETSQIFLSGSGSSGIIERIWNTDFVRKEHTVLVPEAAFPAGIIFAQKAGLPVQRVMLNKDYRINFDNFTHAINDLAEKNRTVGAIFLCNPNNPTGIAEPTQKIVELANNNPDVLVVVSEANIELVNKDAYSRIGGSLLDQKELPENIIVLRSTSKAQGCADFRIGYAIGHPIVMAHIESFNIHYTIPDLAARVVTKALMDKDHIIKSRDYMAKEVPFIVDGLRRIGFPFVTESDSNLILAEVPSYFKNSDELAEKLAEKNCSVISCGEEFGPTIAKKHIRISPRKSEVNASFLSILEEVCEEKKRSQHTENKPTQLFIDDHNPSSATSRLKEILTAGKVCMAQCSI